MRWFTGVVFTGVVVVLLTGSLDACTAGTQPVPDSTSASLSTGAASASSGSGTSSAAGAPTAGVPPTSSPSAPTGSGHGVDPLSGWTLEEKVGQIVMVGVSTSAPQRSSHDVVASAHVGNVFLQGRTSAGRQRVAALVHWFTDQVPSGATHGAPMIVATDQEGGLVQTLSGDGFSAIPSALEQGGLPPAELRSAAASWGSELAAAGVTLDLAPVVDVPTEGGAASNAPVGALRRAYGFAAADVEAHADAFTDGLAGAGVAVAPKHFPGLGRVTGNTDSAAGVVDDVTDASSEQVQVFRHEVARGARFVMVGTASYARLDPGTPAAFSPAVVQGLLRGQLGFSGVVITDDLSGAAQVAAWSPGDRAVKAIEAGCDIVLASKDPSVVPAMVSALVERARTDPAFAAQVDQAARRVLAAKGVA
ncbi:glycoside hydrolase family 3 N-terminal domain-containing protein [Cellulomonas sp. 73-145]|uniref:glycoside hydrolase family 3 N-terminal domain-containing protein n=1 Tax=Cellulomonas sp. 73-145 TaxID=1895739 RepID=UPI000ADA386F|nr:glycoside hydrolase family 3 N-terminal domain-containing protein [Cellulomonas sp. 73-145]